MSSKTPLAHPGNLESSEIGALLSPDTLLSNLRTAVERATNEADRAKFGALATKLEAELTRRSGTAVEGTKGAVADLKNIMNAEDHSLAQRAKQLAETVGGTITPLAGATVTEIKWAAGKAIEAAKAGDLSEVKKLAEGVRETIATNGDKVLEYTGAAALSKVFEPIQKEGFMGIGTVLSNLWKLIAGIFSGKGFSMSEVIGGGTGKVSEKAGQAKDVAKEAFNKGKESAKTATDIVLDPKKLHEAIDQSLPDVIAKMEREFYGDGKMGTAQREKLAQVLKGANFGQDTLRRIKERIENGGDIAKVSDVKDIFLEALFGNVSLIWQLVSYGIIPAHRVAMSATKTAWNSYQYNTSVVFESLNLPSPPVISMTDEELKAQMSETIKNNPAMRDMMLMQMYRVNGFAATALGTVSTLVYSGLNAAFLDTSTKVDGAKLLWAHHAKEADTVLDGLQKMERAIMGGTTPPAWSPLDILREQFEQIKQNAQHLIDAKANPSKAKEIYAKVLISKDPSTLSRQINALFGAQWGLAQELSQTMHKFSQYQEALANPDFLRKLRTLFGSVHLLQMPRQADKLLLSFPNVQTAKETLSQMNASFPGALGGVLRSIPVAGLVIGGVNISQGDGEGKLAEFLNMASAVLIPVFGPLSVMTSSDTSLAIKPDGKWGLEVAHLKENLLNIGFLGLDTAILLNAARTWGVRWVGGAMISRVTDVARLGTDVVRVGNFMKHAAPKLTPQIGGILRAASAMPKKLRIATVFAAALWGGGYALAKSMEDVEKQLVNEGLWDPAKKDITPKMVTKFATMDNERKRLFMDGVYTHFIERLTPDLPDSKTHFEWNVYGFVVESSQDKAALWTVLNAHDSEFGEELRRLWVSITVISREEQNRQSAELSAKKTAPSNNKSAIA
jgi:hypothetical protein